MKKLVLLLLLSISTLFTSLFAQALNADEILARRGEVYFTFTISQPEQILELSRIISIDAFDNGVVKAYANRREFDKFLTYGLKYQVLPPPGESEQPMSDYKNLKATNDWNTYPTYQGYLDMMNAYATNYPNLCQIIDFGTSGEGRKLLTAKVTSSVNTGKPQFFYTSSIHGDETGGFILCLRLIDYLLTNYGTDPRITNMVDNIEILINPLANPDGTYAGGNNSVYGATRYNASFVDVNRNFPDPADGPHPDGNPWQQETLEFMDFATDNHITASANYHGGAELMNYPWDTWSRLAADDSWWVLVSNEYADTAQAHGPSGYFNDFGTGVTNGYAWYRITGGRQDYMNYFQQCREVTIEVSNAKLYPAASLPTLWEANYRSMLNYIEQVNYGIRGIVTDSITGQPIKAQVFVKNHDTDSSWVYSALPYGDYHRPIKAGTWTLEFSAPGYVTKTLNNISVTNYNLVVKDVQLRPFGIYAGFTANATNIQAGNAVDFTDQSVGGANNWQWTFTGGNPSSSIVQNPTGIIYNNEGVYDVTQTASNGTSNNTLTKKHYILVGNQYLMGNETTVTSCEGNFYDDGGPDYNYSPNYHKILTFEPAETGKKVRVIFSSFNIETSLDCSTDYLKIYNGASVSSPLKGTFCGTDSPGSVVSSSEDGTLTFEFLSNNFGSAPGWEATISCDSGVGIPENPTATFNIFPNPAHSNFTIETNTGGLLSIVNATGNQVFAADVVFPGTVVDVSALSNGLYLLKLETATGIIYRKLLKN
jgi:PKD repeat protein